MHNAFVSDLTSRYR